MFASIRERSSFERLTPIQRRTPPKFPRLNHDDERGRRATEFGSRDFPMPSRCHSCSLSKPLGRPNRMSLHLELQQLGSVRTQPTMELPRTCTSPTLGDLRVPPPGPPMPTKPRLVISNHFLGGSAVCMERGWPPHF